MRALKNKLKSAKVDTTEIMKAKGLKGKAKGKPADRGDKSALADTLKFAQRSTASMGVHDQKSSKYESEMVKKKVKRGPDNIKSSDEKDRSINILNGIKRKRENKDGILNSDNMARAHQTETSKKRFNAKK